MPRYSDNPRPRPPGEKIAKEAERLRQYRARCKAAGVLKLGNPRLLTEAVPLPPPKVKVPKVKVPRVKAKKLSLDPPALTVDLARDFVKLLNAGVPQMVAFAYCAPGVLNRTVMRTTIEMWRASELVKEAVRSTSGGEWQVLASDRRIDLALDKHSAELAYYLYSHNYSDAEGEELEKLNGARKALMELNAAGGEGQSGAWALFVKELIAGTAKVSVGPPVLDVLPVKLLPETTH